MEFDFYSLFSFFFINKKGRENQMRWKFEFDYMNDLRFENSWNNFLSKLPQLVVYLKLYIILCLMAKHSYITNRIFKPTIKIWIFKKKI